MDLLQGCNYCSSGDSDSNSNSNNYDADTDNVEQTKRSSRNYSYIAAKPNQNLMIPIAITHSDKISHAVMSTNKNCNKSLQEQQQQQQQQQPSPQRTRRKKRPKLSFSRSVPHTRGNWCGHVFLDIDAKSSIGATLLYRAAQLKIKRFHEFLSLQIDSSVAMSTDANLKNFQIISHLSNKEYDDESSSAVTNSSDSDIDYDPNHARTLKSKKDSFKSNLHISLSRPFYLQEQSILPFVQCLKKRLSFEQSLQCSFLLKDVNKSIQPQDVLVNDDKSRSFLVLSSAQKKSIQEGSNPQTDFIRITSCVDHVMELYNQPLYYKDPKLHVSIASLKGDATVLFQQHPETKFTKLNKSLNTSIHQNVRSTPLNLEKKIEESDLHDDGDDDDDIDFPDIVTLRFQRIICTFGTTKKFEINLRR